MHNGTFGEYLAQKAPTVLQHLSGMNSALVTVLSVVIVAAVAYLLGSIIADQIQEYIAGMIFFTSAVCLLLTTWYWLASPVKELADMPLNAVIALLGFTAAVFIVLPACSYQRK